MEGTEHNVRRNASGLDWDSKKIRIGLTGQVGAGKSAVGRVLAGFGVRVVDADLIARSVYMKGGEGFEDVVEIFGEKILGADGAIDRNRLRQLVLDDSAGRELLEKAVWPTAKISVKREIDGIKSGAIALEAVKLLAASWDDLVDTIWIVEARRDLRLMRILERGLSKKEAEALMQSQPNAEEYRKAAKATSKEYRVICNNGTIGQLRAKISEAWSATGCKNR